MQNVPLLFEYQGRQLIGFAVPLTFGHRQPQSFDIIIDKAFLGTLRMEKQGWAMDPEQDSDLVSRLAAHIIQWYDRKASEQASKQEDTDTSATSLAPVSAS